MGDPRQIFEDALIQQYETEDIMNIYQAFPFDLRQATALASRAGREDVINALASLQEERWRRVQGMINAGATYYPPPNHDLVESLIKLGADNMPPEKFRKALVDGEDDTDLVELFEQNSFDLNEALRLVHQFMRPELILYFLNEGATNIAQLLQFPRDKELITYLCDNGQCWQLVQIPGVPEFRYNHNLEVQQALQNRIEDLDVMRILAEELYW